MFTGNQQAADHDKKKEDWNQKPDWDKDQSLAGPLQCVCELMQLIGYEQIFVDVTFTIFQWVDEYWACNSRGRHTCNKWVENLLLISIQRLIHSIVF